MYRIICYGEILWDMLPTGKSPGGAPMNIALHLNSFGHKTALISRVGKDEAGDELISFLASRNASTKFIQQDDTLETGRVEVVLDGPEDVFFKIPKPVAWDNIQINEEIIEAVKQARMFMYGTLAARSEASKATMNKLLDVANTKVFSVNIRPPHFNWDLVEELIRKADIVKLNEYEFNELLHWSSKGHYTEERGLEFLRTKYKLDTICVTLGRRGAIMNRRGEFYKRDGFDIEVVDKVGSGNAFLSAYLHARAEKKEPAERLTLAVAAGALASTFSGSATDITPEMLEEFIVKKSTVEA